MVNQRWCIAVAVLFAASLGPGCFPHVARQPVDDLARVVVVDAPLDVVLSVSAGERMHVRGSLLEVDALGMSGSMDSTMPGSLPTPFRFKIEQCDLILEYQTKEHLYFCAPSANAQAFHPTKPSLSVLAHDDSVGVRKSKKDGALEWFVDNTRYNNRKGNGGDWIWSRAVRADDVLLRPTSVRSLGKAGEWVALYYAGYYDQKVHFELEESWNRTGKRLEFQFNVANPNQVTSLAIKGFELEVLQVDNRSMSYRWVAVN
jgi:hypothetical protein